jgi:hypothetical protein
MALIGQARADWVEPLGKLVASNGSVEQRMRDVITWLAEPATIEVMRVHSAARDRIHSPPGGRPFVGDVPRNPEGCGASTRRPPIRGLRL